MPATRQPIFASALAALARDPGGDPQPAGETVAEAAFTGAAGSPDTDHARRYSRSSRHRGCTVAHPAQPPSA